MPDIVSRIRVEAQGADQAAREIRKLKEAYDQVAASAKGLSPAAIAGGDPFAQAVSTPGGALAGGQRPADIAERESRSRNYREQVRDRESSNQSFNQAIRRAPGMPGQAIGTAEAMQRGQGGQALGGAMSGLGGLLGGPLGILLMAGGAAALGTQKLAENAFERMQNIWGTGQAQRMGVGFRQIETQQVGFGRMGIPMGMVQQFFSAASQSGLDYTRASAQGGIGAAMSAMGMMGVDPGSAAALLGTLSRGGVNMANVANLGTFSMMRGTFGQPNVTMFTQALTSSIEDALTQGVDMTTERSLRMANQIGAYAEFGGMSPQGAVALNQMMTQRGRGAAQLQRPEDIIAFQAMRQSGMSVTDTLIAMEESPNLVNQQVFQYLKGATGGDQDLLRMRVQQYMGPGATMSQVNKFITTMEKMEGLTPDEVRERLGASDMAWLQVKKDEETGRYESTSEEVRIFQVRQNQMLKDIENTMLQLTTGIQEGIVNLFQGGLPEFAPWAMGKEGYRPDFANQAINEVQTQTVQNIGNLNAEVDRLNLTTREERRLSSFLRDPRFATAISSATALRDNPELRAAFGQLYEMGGTYTQSTWQDYLRRLEETSPEGLAPSIGDWGAMFADIMGGLYTQTEEQLREQGVKRGERYATLEEIFGDITSIRGDQDRQLTDVLDRLARVVGELERRGIVLTDGEE